MQVGENPKKVITRSSELTGASLIGFSTFNTSALADSNRSCVLLDCESGCTGDTQFPAVVCKVYQGSHP